MLCFLPFPSGPAFVCTCLPAIRHLQLATPTFHFLITCPLTVTLPFVASVVWQVVYCASCCGLVVLSCIMPALCPFGPVFLFFSFLPCFLLPALTQLWHWLTKPCFNLTHLLSVFSLWVELLSPHLSLPRLLRLCANQGSWCPCFFFFYLLAGNWGQHTAPFFPTGKTLIRLRIKFCVDHWPER